MGRHAHGELTDGRVKEVRSAILRWRRTRERRTGMPAELWAAAVELARTHGTYRVARALRVAYESLARRLVEAGEGQTDETQAGKFVELRGADLLGGTTVIEVSDEDGGRMTIRLGASGALALAAALVSAFRRRAA
jgi:hypothetical protein